MNPRIYRIAALGVGLLLAVVAATALLLVVALDRGALRHPLMHVLSWQMGRSLAVKGMLNLHLLSTHPTLEATEVTLGNPPWTPAGVMGTTQRLLLTFRWGQGLDGLQLEGADLNLMRDTDGFANWQFRRPEPGHLALFPLLHHLAARDVHLHLADAQRHLEYDGTVSGGSVDGAPLKLTGQGVLNGRPAQLTLSGDPLQTVSMAQAYRFEFAAAGDHTHVSLKGSLPRPFELDLHDAAFEATGEDLRDLYFLIGLRLMHTVKFRLTGMIQRRGTATRFDELALSAGESDLAGSLSIETHGRDPRIEGELHSRLLRVVDLGPRAAKHDSSVPPLFSDSPLSLSAVRHSEARLSYRAEHVLFGRFDLSGVTGRLQIEHAVIDVPAFDGQLLGGRFGAQLHLDATHDQPPVEFRLQLQGGQLQALPFQMDNAPLSGPLQIAVHLTGRGRSVHEVAASAEGSVAFRVQDGTIRASIAELAGLDLRGIGLTLAHSQREIGLRCALGRFQATAGVLRPSRLTVDTDTVLIRGQGSIQLGDESLDLQLQGEPKQTRLLRVTSPLLIRGDLRKPTVSAQAQGASIKLIDRGTAQSIACDAL